MHRIKLTIEYDGSNYYGWQFQNKQVTIQEEIERAVSIILKMDIRVTGAGRTDTGVHARNQVAHLDIPDFDLDKLKQSINGILKPDIRIKNIEKCTDDFHARFDAKIRYYRYQLSQNPTAINRAFAWQIFFPINITVMQEGAKIIAGIKDFKSFCKTKSNVKNHLCDISISRWLFKDDLLIYEIAANRFLHGMVRTLVGTMMDVALGKYTIDDFGQIFNARDRTLAGQAAPAKGLVLEEIIY